MSKFQIVVTLFLGLSIAVFFAIMVMSKGKSGTSVIHVTIWGTSDQIVFDTFLKSIFGEDKTVLVTYVQKSKSAFDQSLINALADGVAPDIILLSESTILNYINRIYQIPAQNYPLRQFRDNFIEGAEIFVGTNGILALPLSVDPLVMYWNRDIFSNAAISVAPKYWDETLLLPGALTKTNSDGSIKQSALALGEYMNIENSKNILSGLFLQLGNPIVIKSPLGYTSSLLKGTNINSAIRFYTDFSNHSSPLYSWNRSMSNDKSYFLEGKLGVYFGKASELRDIRSKNPNLNFDVSYFPQLRDASTRIVPASFIGIAILKTTPNPLGLISVLTRMTDKAAINAWSYLTLLPPTRRDSIATKPSDAYLSIFYDSALWSKGWLDPAVNSTSAIFSDLIENITSNRKNYSDSINEADNKLNNILSSMASE